VKEYLLLQHEVFKGYKILSDINKIDFTDNFVAPTSERVVETVKDYNPVNKELLTSIFKPITSENVSEKVEPLTEFLSTPLNEPLGLLHYNYN
jgi:hypothetical protein